MSNNQVESGQPDFAYQFLVNELDCPRQYSRYPTCCRYYDVEECSIPIWKCWRAAFLEYEEERKTKEEQGR